MTALIGLLRSEPIALRAVAIIGANIAVASGWVDPGANAEANAVILGVLNLLLLKGARDRVSPVEPAA